MQMTRPKLLLFAYSMTGAQVFEELLRLKANIAAVYTYEDNPKENWFASVKQIALKNNIPAFTPEKIDEAEIMRIKKIAPDIILSVYYRSLLPNAVLESAPRGAFNMHGSLLPKYRGRAPINWVLVKGEKETGATLHYMVVRADAGDIADQEIVPIAFEDDAFSLTQKVSAAAVRIIKRSYGKIEEGKIKPVKQDLSAGAYFGRRTPQDGLIDWSCDETTIYNLVRAVTRPFPGAFTFLGGKKIIIWKALPLKTKTNAPCGTIISQNPLAVATAGNDLQIVDFETDIPKENLKGQLKGE